VGGFSSGGYKRTGKRHITGECHIPLQNDGPCQALPGGLRDNKSVQRRDLPGPSGDEIKHRKTSRCVGGKQEVMVSQRKKARTTGLRAWWIPVGGPEMEPTSMDKDHEKRSVLSAYGRDQRSMGRQSGTMNKGLQSKTLRSTITANPPHHPGVLLRDRLCEVGESTR